MLWSTRYINRSNALCGPLCALILLCQRIAGTGLVPRDFAAVEVIARRVCDSAAPDVTESSIIASVCNQTPANGSPTCSNEMTSHMQESATNTCRQYLGFFTDCMEANNDDHTACSDALFGYQDCHNYTMQAYAYCGCYYTLPASLADCANEQLQPQSQDTAKVISTNALVTATSTSLDMVASTFSADEEPTPAVVAVSGGAASPSSQSTVTISDSRIPSAPTVHLTSLRSTALSGGLNTVWISTAAPSTSTEPITVAVTYTTIVTADGYTATATLISTSTTTVYTCADGGDVIFPVPASVRPVLPPPTPIMLAPVDPETSAPHSPHSAVVPAQSTGARTAKGPTQHSQSGSQETSTSTHPSVPAPSPTQSTEAGIAQGTRGQSQSGTQATSASTSTSPSTAPFIAAPPLSAGSGPSETTGGRNESAVCARCRRRSKIL